MRHQNYLLVVHCVHLPFFYSEIVQEVSESSKNVSMPQSIEFLFSFTALGLAGVAACFLQWKKWSQPHWIQTNKPLPCSKRQLYALNPTRPKRRIWRDSWIIHELTLRQNIYAERSFNASCWIIRHNFTQNQLLPIDTRDILKFLQFWMYLDNQSEI